MDEKELNQNEEFDLDSILNEFGDTDADGAPEDPEVSSLLEDLSPADEEESSTSESVFTEDISEEAASEPLLSEEIPEETVLPDPAESAVPVEDELSAEDAVSAEDEAQKDTEDAVFSEQTFPQVDLSDVDLSDFSPDESELAPEESEGEDSEEEASEIIEEENAEDSEAAPQPHIVYDPQAKLRELKHKLVNGPEKRYYALSELGVGKLQIAVFVNVLLVLACTAGAVLFAAGRIPGSRMRLLIFTQVLAMLISGLLGFNQILDGFSELLKGRFSINTLLGITFLACIADAFFSLRDLRVPCCCAFCLQMTFALSARCQQRNTEMGQMDTLRKAVRLHGLVKVDDYYKGDAAFLRSEGQLEDFMDNYEKSSGPRKLQSFYAFLSFLICIGIAVLAGMLHGVSLAVQIFAASLMVAVPASFFIALTRPAAILERRLHMVGAVLCGWSGVKALSGKAVFPITDSDLFPLGSTKLNGIKFYSDRDPDMIVSYTASLILEAGSNLTPVFEQLMNSRGVVSNPVYNFHIYEGGGLGGDVCGEPVLLGTTEFLQSMGVHIPEGSMVSQAVYAAIDNELCAVVAVSFAKMRSSAAGMVTLCGYRKLTPIFVGSDFMLSESFIRSKFEIRTRHLQFPSAEERTALSAKQPLEGQPSLAIAARPDLISFAYAVTGARALRVSSRWGMALHLTGGILGLLSMLILAITGSTELLTPVNILLYQLVWLIPGYLITEWVRHV